MHMVWGKASEKLKKLAVALKRMMNNRLKHHIMPHRNQVWIYYKHVYRVKRAYKLWKSWLKSRFYTHPSDPASGMKFVTEGKCCWMLFTKEFRGWSPGDPTLLPSCEELVWGCAALGTHKVSYKAICSYKFFYSGSISPLCGAPADSPAWCMPASLQAGVDGWNIVHFWGCVTDWLWWGRFGGHLPKDQPCISWSVNVWECPRGWRWGKGWESLKCAQMRALTQEVGLGRRGDVEEWGAPGHWGLWTHAGTKFNPKITFKLCGSLVRPIFH